MGQLTRRAHSLFDAYLICLLFLLPVLFGMEGLPRLILWSLCVVHFFVTVLSDTPYGAGLIPFPLHGMIELLVAVAFPIVPYALGWDNLPNERHIFVGLGFALFALWFLTDYKFETNAWTKEAHVDTGVDIIASQAGH